MKKEMSLENLIEIAHRPNWWRRPLQMIASSVFAGEVLRRRGREAQEFREQVVNVSGLPPDELRQHVTETVDTMMRNTAEAFSECACAVPVMDRVGVQEVVLDTYTRLMEDAMAGIGYTQWWGVLTRHLTDRVLQIIDSGSALVDGSIVREAEPGRLNLLTGVSKIDSESHLQLTVQALKQSMRRMTAADRRRPQPGDFELARVEFDRFLSEAAAEGREVNTDFGLLQEQVARQVSSESFGTVGDRLRNKVCEVVTRVGRRFDADSASMLRLVGATASLQATCGNRFVILTRQLDDTVTEHIGDIVIAVNEQRSEMGVDTVYAVDAVYDTAFVIVVMMVFSYTLYSMVAALSGCASFQVESHMGVSAADPRTHAQLLKDYKRALKKASRQTFDEDELIRQGILVDEAYNRDAPTDYGLGFAQGIDSIPMLPGESYPGEEVYRTPRGREPDEPEFHTPRSSRSFRQFARQVEDRGRRKAATEARTGSDPLLGDNTQAFLTQMDKFRVNMKPADFQAYLTALDTEAQMLLTKRRTQTHAQMDKFRVNMKPADFQAYLTALDTDNLLLQQADEVLAEYNELMPGRLDPQDEGDDDDEGEDEDEDDEEAATDEDAVNEEADHDMNEWLARFKELDHNAFMTEHEIE